MSGCMSILVQKESRELNLAFKRPFPDSVHMQAQLHLLGVSVSSVTWAQSHLLHSYLGLTSECDAVLLAVSCLFN